MATFDYMALKSGTDVRGVALDGVAGEPLNLTDEVVENIASAFCLWLSEKQGKPADALKIAVGNDSRLSADRMRAAVIRAANRMGVFVYNSGLSSTPAMFMTTLELGVDGAIQLTASHHPYHRNGLKFFTKDGGLESGDIGDILTRAGAGNFPGAETEGTSEEIDFMARYCELLRARICKEVNAVDYEKPLAGKKIIVDAGNGAGGFYAWGVLEPLGADITGSQFLEPDGHFPNHIPNPENAEAMQSACDAVVRSGADLGIIFDTDVDRAGCVDASGREINRNRLVALASCIALEGNAGGTIVTDSVTSDGLKVFIEQELGGRHHRFKRGYKNVINEAVRLIGEGTNAPLAIETSGHAALKENYFLDDGAYLVTKIIIKMAQLAKAGKQIDDLIAKLQEPKESAEIRPKIKAADFRACGEQAIALVEKTFAAQEDATIADDSYEGIRVSFPTGKGDGWFLLRLSVHDPVMPLNIESNAEGGCKQIAQTLYDVLKQAEGLDLQPLETFLN